MARLGGKLVAVQPEVVFDGKSSVCNGVCLFVELPDGTLVEVNLDRDNASKLGTDLTSAARIGAKQ